MEKFELPVPTQEKIGRVVTWGIIGAVVVLAGNLLLPHVNVFLGFVQTALSTLTNISISFVGLVFLSYVVMKFAPLVKQGVDAFANRATWALLNADPVAHLRIWWEEVLADKKEFGVQLEGVGQAVATVEQSKADAQASSDKAQKLYNSGMKQGRQADVQTHAVTAGKYAESAKRYEKMLGPLKMLEAELQKLYAVYEREEFNLRTDIDIQSKEWEVATRTGKALDAAFRFLTKKSKKQMFAEQASQLIGDRYAGQFGRLRTLKNLSHDLISTFDLETGEYDAIAYENWKKQSALVIDNHSGQLEQVPMARIESAQLVPRF